MLLEEEARSETTGAAVVDNNVGAVVDDAAVVDDDGGAVVDDDVDAGAVWLFFIVTPLRLRSRLLNSLWMLSMCLMATTASSLVISL